MSGEQGRNKGQERLQASRQIDVHVRDNLRAALRPSRPNRQPFSLLGERAQPYSFKRTTEVRSDLRRPVRAPVVRDDDLGGEGKRLIEVLPQPANAGLEVLLLVVDRDDDIDVEPLRASVCSSTHWRRLANSLRRIGRSQRRRGHDVIEAGKGLAHRL